MDHIVSTVIEINLRQTGGPGSLEFHHLFLSNLIHSFIHDNLWSALCRECRIRGAGGSGQVVSYWQSSEFVSF